MSFFFLGVCFLRMECGGKITWRGFMLEIVRMGELFIVCIEVFYGIGGSRDNVGCWINR